jgi:SAM-dependent methyltransferase
VRDQWGRHFDQPWPGSLDRFPDLPNVHSIAAGIEEESQLPAESYDLIVSQAVGEHVRDINSFAAATYRMLRPGGTALHVIDFSCHGFFPNEPLRFLTIPDHIWHLMGSNRGIPNRRRVHEMEYSFRLQPFREVTIVERHLLDAPIPKQLAHIPSESALTHWAVFLVRK